MSAGCPKCKGVGWYYDYHQGASLICDCEPLMVNMHRASPFSQMVPITEEAIEAARATGYREGLERAAAICDGWAYEHATDLAERIRAEASPTLEDA